MRSLLAFLLAIALSAFAGTPPVNAFNSSAHPSKLYGFVIEDDPDFGDDGYKTMMVMSRESAALPWQRWDNVAVFTLPPPGTFAEWAAARIATVNVRVKALTGDPSPPPAIAIPPDTPTPATWLEIKAWFLANTHWTGSWLAYGKLAQPPPVPPVESVTWGPRAFHGGYAWDLGTEDGTKLPAARVMVDGTWRRARIDNP